MILIFISFANTACGSKVCVFGGTKWDGESLSGCNAFLKEERCESAISRVLSWAIIHLALQSPAGSSSLPGPSAGHAVRDSIWPCSRWGLPSPALLPGLRCALTAPFHPYRPCGRRFPFCCTFRRLSPPRRYLAPCPVEPGLSSPSFEAAIAWPTHGAHHNVFYPHGKFYSR